MFSIAKQEIDIFSLNQSLKNSSAGAFVSFEGRVRNHNEGKEVLLLEYEAYEKLANKEATKIFAEAREKFDVLDIKCVHRVGKLNIEDIAVWVGVISVHRGSAFKACEYVIDQVKTRLPIWKKEYYQDNDSDWVNCEHCASHAY